MIPSGQIPTPSDVIAATEPERRRHDAAHLLGWFSDVTGFAPRVWNGGIIGYGRYRYTYQSGRSGVSLATGFAPRKAALSIYIMPGYQDYGDMLAQLGKHKKGKACLYVNKLDDIDIEVLATLVCRGLADLDKRWPVEPT